MDLEFCFSYCDRGNQTRRPASIHRGLGRNARVSSPRLFVWNRGVTCSIGAMRCNHVRADAEGSKRSRDGGGGSEMGCTRRQTVRGMGLWMIRGHGRAQRRDCDEESLLWLTSCAGRPMAAADRATGRTSTRRLRDCARVCEARECQLTLEPCPTQTARSGLAA